MNNFLFLYVLLICIIVSRGSFRVGNDYKSKDNSVLLSTNTKDNIEKPSKINHITEFFDSQRKIIVQRNEITNKCTLKLIDDQKFNSSLKLSEIELVEIIGENIINFCKEKVIILNNVDDDLNVRFRRSKRSIDKKRYQGQTQTQFVSFGSKNSNQETKNGLAEALSQPDLSRATVSGLNGMGQAQSQSSFNDCNECSHDYRTHVSNTYPENPPMFQPQSSVLQNTRPNTFLRYPNVQNERSNVGPLINQQYPNSEINNKVPDKQKQEYDIRPVGSQYPSTYLGGETNNREPGKYQDQEYGNEPFFGEQYPNTRASNNISNIQGQSDKISLNNKNPNIYSGLRNNNLPEKLDQRFGYGFGNEQILIPINTNSPESKKTGNTNTADLNIYPDGSNSFNLNGWSYPNKVTSNPSNQQIYPGGSGFPSFPSGSSQGILSPHNSANHNGEWTYPNNNQIIFPTNPQSRATNYQLNILPNYSQQTSSSLGQLTPTKPFSDAINTQLPRNTNKNQGFNQLNFPSLCNFLYQTCVNALSNNREPNKFQNTSGLQNTQVTQQNTESNINEGKQFSGTRVPSVQQPDYGFPLYSREISQKQPNYDQPQSKFRMGESGDQQSGYVLSGGKVNPNQIQPNYVQLQSSLGFGESGYAPSGGNININKNKIQPNYEQQFGYIPSGGVHPNQIQSSYSHPQNTLGTGGSGIQQTGYIPPGGNANPNQIPPGYGQPESPLRPVESSIWQSSYVPSGRNINLNKMQSNYGQQFGYIPSDRIVNPNQMQPSYSQPQNMLGNGESGVGQSGYISSGEHFNPNQIQSNNGKPEDTLGTRRTGTQQSGYSPYSENAYPNQVQSGQYEQPQGISGFGGSGVLPLGYTPFGYGNEPSSFQPVLGGDKIRGNYPQSNGDNNYYKGQQFGLGSQVENNDQTQNPIIGGQFGTDISSGSSVMPIDTEGGDAQSMTNVNVDGQETSASASAQGKSKSGMTQTQVSGSYAGTGMFSAQAQTSDNDKGTQSQIISNTNGTTSSAQGKGGKGQAQSQVTYNSESGIALGEAQSSGINYGTNTQLQAGIKGGLADAQSTGTGSTSSQAQIGFLPYEFNNNTNQKSLFKGGGTASSQGGLNNGQSQSQLFGSYKHGISYNGAAQASSGKKLQNLPKLNLDNAKFKIGLLERSNDNLIKNETNVQPQQPISSLLRSQSFKEENVNNIKQNISKTNISSLQMPQESSLEADSEYENNDEEYDDEKDDTVNTKSTQIKSEISPQQSQNIILNLDDKHDAQITRDSDSQLKNEQVLDAGQIIPGTNGTKIPAGFRGRVASVAGDQTEAKAIPGGQAQTQTVLLSPGAGGLTVVDKTMIKALLGQESYIGPINKPYNHFQTDMTGETGKFNPKDKNVQYFTKSSTCGYFSFSCNYVNGTKSGAKICKPNPPPFPCQRNN